MNTQKNFTKVLGCIKFYTKKETSSIMLGRPLLKLSRFECLKFCEFWNLPIYPDFTNFHMNSCRNRLRLQCIPYLKYFFNLNLTRQISQIQELINLENQYFQFLNQKIFFSKNKHFIPKIFQYRILHSFFYFSKKSSSFRALKSKLN